ncbi:MAG: hypothetical protein LBF32_02230 [Streptococcaceae bacterium]|jgi:hypothetical protein|nr:hypothetical protein [Streptococcaceae bacterium]
MEIKKKSFRSYFTIFFVFIIALIQLNYHVYAEDYVTNETGQPITMYEDEDLKTPLKLEFDEENCFFWNMSYNYPVTIPVESKFIIFSFNKLQSKSLKVKYQKSEEKEYEGFIPKELQFGKPVHTNESGNDIPILQKEDGNLPPNYSPSCYFLAENELFVIQKDEDAYIEIKKFDLLAGWIVGYIQKDAYRAKLPVKLEVPLPTPPIEVAPAPPTIIDEEEPTLPPHTIGTPFLTIRYTLPLDDFEEEYGSFRLLLGEGRQDFKILIFPGSENGYNFKFFVLYNPAALEGNAYHIDKVQEGYQAAVGESLLAAKKFVFEHNNGLLVPDYQQKPNSFSQNPFDILDQVPVKLQTLLYGSYNNRTNGRNYFTFGNSPHFTTDKLKLHVAASPEIAEKVYQICIKAVSQSKAYFKFASNEAALTALMGIENQANKFLTIYPPFVDERKNNIFFAYLVLYLNAELEEQELSINSVQNPSDKLAIQKGDGLSLPGDSVQLVTFRDEDQPRQERRTVKEASERELSLYRFYQDLVRSLNPGNPTLRLVRSFVHLPELRVFKELTSERIKDEGTWLGNGSIGTVIKIPVGGEFKVVKEALGGDSFKKRLIKDEFDKTISLTHALDEKVRESLAQADEYAKANVAALLQSTASINIPEGQTPNGGLVLPWIDGGTLGKVVNDSTYTTDKNERKIHLLQFFSALMALDATDSVHEDLKDDNIMIENNGRLRIVDLGTLAKAGEGNLVSQASIHGPEYLMRSVQESHLGCSKFGYESEKSELEEQLTQLNDLMGRGANPYPIDERITATRTTDVWSAGVLSLTILFGQSGQAKSQELFYRKDHGNYPCQYMIETKGRSEEEKLTYFKTITEQLNDELPVQMRYEPHELETIAVFLSKAIVPDPEQRETTTNLFDYCLREFF